MLKGEKAIDILTWFTKLGTFSLFYWSIELHWTFDIHFKKGKEVDDETQKFFKKWICSTTNTIINFSITLSNIFEWLLNAWYSDWTSPVLISALNTLSKERRVFKNDLLFGDLQKIITSLSHLQETSSHSEDKSKSPASSQLM